MSMRVLAKIPRQEVGDWVQVQVLALTYFWHLSFLCCKTSILCKILLAELMGLNQIIGSYTSPAY